MEGAMEPLTTDIAIIGAGVSGACIARQLSAYETDVTLLEKEVDVSFGVSKANSGIIHGGFHHSPRYLKTRLEIQGNLMFDRLQRELDFPFSRCGILVVAMNEEEMKYISHLYTQGVENGAIGIEMCSRERMFELEPKLDSDCVGGLHAPGGGVIEPYRFVFSLVESARKNGVKLMTGFNVTSAEWTGDKHRIHAVDGRVVEARWVVNAAGLQADTVSRIFGGEDFTVHPRKGEYYLLDRKTKVCPQRVLFPVPTRVSKGMLVIPTAEGTVLIGPTAVDIEDKEDLSTNEDQLSQILDQARKMVPGVSRTDIIAAFSGLRPALEDPDFYIDISGKAPNLIQVAGIQSPGLTASPAIGEYVKDLLKKAGCRLTEKADYDPYVTKMPRIRDYTPFEAEELLASNPAYGNLVCRCEKISEAEIVEAIRRGHTTLDGIKYFTRAQMGRCQGGFCSYKIIKLIMRETGLRYDRITKRGPGSEILTGSLEENPREVAHHA
ncbi:MAG: FAD/NAD(P)-binding oxidoreductase [Spirochaetaceae bacterium]|nr:MAG: FAD/NAD(P)-binding oxidoreductase [Spirochaetaceae bacterium]